MRIFALTLVLLLPFLAAAASPSPSPSPPTTGCIHYRGMMPFSDTLPFEATVVEDSKSSSSSTTLCWLHTTYAEHNLMQILQNQYRSPEEKRKDERGDGDYNTWGFRRWDMECLDDVSGWVNVGLRTVGIKDEREVKAGGKKRDVAWVTDVKEDVWGEKWVFSKDVNCEKEKTKEKPKGKVVELGKNKGVPLEQLSEPERKKELAQELIRAAVGGQSEKDEDEVKLMA